MYSLLNQDFSLFWLLIIFHQNPFDNLWSHDCLVRKKIFKNELSVEKTCFGLWWWLAWGGNFLSSWTKCITSMNNLAQLLWRGLKSGIFSDSHVKNDFRLQSVGNILDRIMTVQIKNIPDTMHKMQSTLKKIFDSLCKNLFCPKKKKSILSDLSNISILAARIAI